MGVETKALFMQNLEDQLRTELIASDMDKVLSIIADQIGDYDITRINSETVNEDDLLSAYLAALEIQGRSASTIQRYTYIINKMMKYVNLPVKNITVYHLRDYLAHEKRRGLSDTSLDGERQIFNAYFNWLSRENLINKNPTANLGSIKCQKKIKQIYSDVDLEKLKCNAKTPRDKAIVCFLFSSACRVSEMTSLNKDSINLDNLECKVLGKGNKERTVYIDSVTAMAIREYLDRRDDACDALFASNIGVPHRITPGGVREMLKKLGGNTLVEHVHPHKFRRTKATKMIKRGMAIQEVAAILGHDKLDTTMEYVVLNNTDVKNSYQKYS